MLVSAFFVVLLLIGPAARILHFFAKTQVRSVEKEMKTMGLPEAKQDKLMHLQEGIPG